MVLDMVRDVRRDHPRMGGKKLYWRLKEDLMRLDRPLGRDKFLDLLGASGLLVERRKKYAVTTKSFSRFSRYGDHFNGKEWGGPHQAWVGDITYIRVGDSFRYLFLLTDAYSRKIVGWHLGDSLETRWALEALKKAVKQCPDPRGLVHHSDRGFQYCSRSYTSMLQKSGIKSSMGQAGNCYDNAMAERVNGILKTEYLLDSTFKNVDDAYRATKQAIKSYNEGRPHMSLDMGIPEQVHQGEIPVS